MPALPADFFGVKEIAANRGGMIDAFTLGDSTRTFLGRVPPSEGDVDESWILYHPDVPLIRSAHPTRLGLFCYSKQATPAAAPASDLWLLTCTYNQTPRAELPWLEPALYAFGQQCTEQVVDYDVVTNKAIMNSAKCPFDPAVTATRYEAVMTVSKNMLSFSADVAQAYVGAVNSVNFFGAAPGYCMCVGMPAQQQIYQNEQGYRTIYWAAQASFAFRNTFSWQARVLDAGYMELRDGKLVPCLLAGGREPTSPVPFDSAGKQVSNPANFTPNFLDFKIYPEMNFHALFGAS